MTVIIHKRACARPDEISPRSAVSGCRDQKRQFPDFGDDVNVYRGEDHLSKGLRIAKPVDMRS